jgi:serine/threonine-protein kinase
LPGAAGGRYRLLEEVGRGGMGVVHRGRDPHLGRELAVKVLREDHKDDPQAVRRFVGEARIAGQLQHPGVVPVYELGDFPDGRPFFTMKLVQGRTLAQLLAARRDPAEDLPRLVKTFEQVCQTVAYAHSKGVIHRDLKPLNVMVGAFGEVQVMDWGLAKALGEDPVGSGEPPRPEAGCMAETGRARRTEPDTEPGAVLGTYAYMAPEQARGAVGALDERCDVFGLGAILCEILTGQPPYTAAESWQVYPKAAMADLGEAHGRLGGCGADAELVALAKRCVAVEPANRPRDAGAVAAAVTAYLEGAQERLRRAEVERAAAQARAEEERKRRRVAAALAAAVLLLFALGGGAWLWVRSERAARQAETEGAINLALGKAGQLRDQARQIKVASPARAAEALAVWKQALAAAEQAEEIGAAGLVGEETGGRAGWLLAELRAGEKQAQQTVAQSHKDARLLADLEEARMAHSAWKGQSFDMPAGAAAYAKAFAAYGLNVLSHDPEVTVRALRRLPARMGEALAVALDDWTSCASAKDVGERLRAVAGAVDDDPWRRRFRRARDLKVLQALAIEARRKPLPPVSFDLLAIALSRGGAGAEAVALWREAQGRYPADFWINYNLGTALRQAKEGSKQGLDEAIGYYRAALARRPDNAPAHNDLGNALMDKGDVAAAIAAYRKAIALDRKFAPAHYNLGYALKEKGDVAGAVAEYQKAVALAPQYAPAHSNLGLALQAQGDVAGAVAAYQKAVALDPKDAKAHGGLGNAFKAQGDVAGAVAAYQKAVALDPKYAPAHYNLGLALKEKEDLAGAVAAYRKAIALDPRLAEAHCNLGLALLAQGRLRESLASLRRGHALGSRRPGWRNPSALWVKRAERLVELDQQLPAFLKGERQPRNAAEALTLAGLCQPPFRQRYAAAVRFYHDAFTAEPKLAEILRAGRRYNAACAAALAGCGQGKDAASLDAKERSRLRRQALAWLQADLTAWRNLLEKAPKQVPSSVGQMLQHWQTDSDLAGVRDQGALAKLPEAERREWAKHWGDVAALLDKASPKK